MGKGGGQRRARPEGRGRADAGPRLPAGRHGLPREFVARNQRERIITALVDAVAEKGYNDTTVADITKAAAVSRRTFYEHFAGKEECFLAAYDMVVEHIRGAMVVAAGAFEEWPQKVRAALATLLRFLAGEPDLARLCLIEPVAAAGEIAARHRATMREAVEMVRAGRPAHTGARPLPETTEEAVVGGIAALIVRELGAGRAAGLEQQLPQLVELVLAPYLGAEEAERQAQEPAPA